MPPRAPNLGAVLKLYIGTKNLSSWSLRPWLCLKHAGAEFTEQVIVLDQPDTKAKLGAISPSARVPVLVDEDLVIWDSIAIAEYVAEKFPEAHLWPSDPKRRAVARAVSAEMHAGFGDMRREMAMNVMARTPKHSLPEPVRRDVERVLAIVRDCLAQKAPGGPFLFGHFTIADAMYAPVVTRFVTYDIAVPPDVRTYMDAVVALPAMQAWIAAAKAEVTA